MPHAQPGRTDGASSTARDRTRPEATRSLDWLAGTDVRAGVLALWVGDPADGRLVIEGLHGVGDLRLGAEVRLDELTSLPVPAPGPGSGPARETWVVVPVADAGHACGLLALLEVGEADDDRHHVHHHWAALLCSALQTEWLAAERTVLVAQRTALEADRTALEVQRTALESERDDLRQQLRQVALYDAVTGLPNRRLFLDRLATAIELLARVPSAAYSVVFLDLDGFKLVNDSLGHQLGDELLRVMGERLRAELRSADTGARFGGDEFAILLTGAEPDDVLVIARRLQERIAAPVLLAGHEVLVTASIGIATSASGYVSAQDVLRDADTAMYQSKETRRGTATLFDPAMHARASNRLRNRAELRTALDEDQFVVHYQPIVTLNGSGVAAFEALVRWQHPERGLLLPGHFLPDMEDNSTIVALGSWLVDEVCRRLAEWRRSYAGPLAVSINVSNLEFWSDGLVESVQAATARHGVPASSLVLEITESVIMTDPRRALKTMNRLRALGHRLHVDDFGTGQSSLNALRTFPVDALKIDGSFVRELEGYRTAALVRAIVDMASALGMEVIAECVETSEQAEQLRGMGCGNAQGWLYARAVPGAEAGRMLGNVLAETI